MVCVYVYLSWDCYGDLYFCFSFYCQQIEVCYVLLFFQNILSSFLWLPIILPCGLVCWLKLKAVKFGLV